MFKSKNGMFIKMCMEKICVKKFRNIKGEMWQNFRLVLVFSEKIEIS